MLRSKAVVLSVQPGITVEKVQSILFHVQAGIGAQGELAQDGRNVREEHTTMVLVYLKRWTVRHVLVDNTAVNLD